MNKKILAVTHNLSDTGAPTALKSMLEILYNMGFQICVVSMEDGEQRIQYEKMGILVQVYCEFWKNKQYIDYICEEFDFIIVNTMALYEAVLALNGKAIEVKWWLHEPGLFMKPLPVKLEQNITIYAAGAVTKAGVKEVLGYDSELLNFGLSDMALSKVHTNKPDEKIGFVMAGIYSYVKAQDLLANAIKMLPDVIRKKCRFLFIGSYGDEIYLKGVKQLSKEYEEVVVMPGVDRERMPDVYGLVDCVIAPSRMDATPAVIVEGMMLKKICICSDATGVSHYMTDCENGFVFRSEDVVDLANHIILVVNNFHGLERIRENGRKIYEEHYALDVFEKNIRKIFLKES